MTCKMCKERIKNWQGSDSVCYFDNPAHNWNCATINAIRDIFAPDGWYVELENLPMDVCAIRNDDMTYGLICFNDIDLGDDEGMVGCLYVSWYKRRGNTEALWIIGEDTQPRRPTEKELLAIIHHFKEGKDDRVRGNTQGNN